MTHDITLTLIQSVLDDEAATLAYAARFAKIVQSGLIVYLHGDLGAGKTTFVRGVLHGLGYVGKVKSPTYTLVEEYAIKSDQKVVNKNFNYILYHFDLYRFVDENEWEAAGFRDYFNSQTVCMIEWPEKAEQVLPNPDVHVQLLPLNNGRQIRLIAASTLGVRCLAQF